MSEIRHKHSRSFHERYELGRSPFAQKPTQKALAELVGLSRSQMDRLVREKEKFVVRREQTVRNKVRALVYPRGALRGVHERLKFHCSKIRHGPYLFSPRHGRSQRDNAILHVGQRQILLLDIRQFYPSTSSEHVFRWAHYRMGMFDDVAGVFTKLCTIDDRVSFGSPLTPVLVSLIHRDMFDAIAAVCQRRGLRISLWVDDIVISGNYVPGELVKEVRELISGFGLKSHKIKFRNGSQHTYITGMPIIGGRIVSPQYLNIKVRDLYAELVEFRDHDYCYPIVNRLLSALGTQRYIYGRRTPEGQQISVRMNALRQEFYHGRPVASALSDGEVSGVDAPWA